MKHMKKMINAALLFALLAGSANAADKYAYNLPPSAALRYTISAHQSGLKLDGSALIDWSVSKNHYAISSSTEASLLGKLLEVKSEGDIDQHGLAPTQFTEKRWRKDATIVTFDRASKKISFSASPATYPINGGEQDRSSVMWQLIAVARGTRGKFAPQSTWNFFVAGQKDAEPWSFKVMQREAVTTPAGEFNAVHLVKQPVANGNGQQLEVWLAPTLEWYPLRIRITEANGDTIEQNLAEVTRKPAG